MNEEVKNTQTNEIEIEEVKKEGSVEEVHEEKLSKKEEKVHKKEEKKEKKDKFEKKLEAKDEEIKKQYAYTTSETQYILPSEYCAIHTFVETIPPNPYIPVDPFNPAPPIDPQNPFNPVTPTPTPVPEATDPFSNDGFQSH